MKTLTRKTGAVLLSDPLRQLPNIGEKLSKLLRMEGVKCAEDIARLGPPVLYQRLQARFERRLPVCYYLYSLEGAMRGIHWDALTPEEKCRLRKAAGLRQ